MQVQHQQLCLWFHIGIEHTPQHIFAVKLQPHERAAQNADVRLG